MYANGILKILYHFRNPVIFDSVWKIKLHNRKCILFRDFISDKLRTKAKMSENCRLHIQLFIVMIFAASELPQYIVVPQEMSFSGMSCHSGSMNGRFPAWAGKSDTAFAEYARPTQSGEF